MLRFKTKANLKKTTCCELYANVATLQHVVLGKMFASSSFYAKGLHPTVEDQVELARRISSSLSDISNKSSKGQAMYVNRKKRSVKWVHESDGTYLVRIR